MELKLELEVVDQDGKEVEDWVSQTAVEMYNTAAEYMNSSGIDIYNGYYEKTFGKRMSYWDHPAYMENYDRYFSSVLKMLSWSGMGVSPEKAKIVEVVGDVRIDTGLSKISIIVEVLDM